MVEIFTGHPPVKKIHQRKSPSLTFVINLIIKIKTIKTTLLSLSLTLSLQF
jgi:hypothetical protein